MLTENEGCKATREQDAQELSMTETDFSPARYFRPAAESATRTAGVTLSTGDKTALGNKVDHEKVACGVRMILEAIGENPDREGLKDTPARVARMFQELVYGHGIDAASEITCTFEEETDELVLVRDIPFSSMCEHHLVPFIGSAHIAYIPSGGKITGLSKLARVVEVSSRKLQVQERMTTEIADALVRKLSPLGVMVIIEAEHLCMSIRGIKKAGSRTLTSAVRGCIRESSTTRAEIMSLLSRS